MPAPKKPETFDAHLGAVINGLARPHGGREWLMDLLGVSKKTIDRRMTGENSLLVKELQLVADAVNSTPEDLVEQALRNYGDGDRDAGLAKLHAEARAISDAAAVDVGDVHEDDFVVTPGGPKADLALAANKRPKKVDVPHAE